MASRLLDRVRGAGDARAAAGGADRARGRGAAAGGLGARNQEIAERLVISEKTAKNTLSRGLQELGAASALKAVARGRSLGLPF